MGGTYAITHIPSVLASVSCVLGVGRLFRNVLYIQIYVYLYTVVTNGSLYASLQPLTTLYPSFRASPRDLRLPICKSKFAPQRYLIPPVPLRRRILIRTRENYSDSRWCVCYLTFDPRARFFFPLNAGFNFAKPWTFDRRSLAPLSGRFCATDIPD